MILYFVLLPSYPPYLFQRCCSLGVFLNVKSPVSRTVVRSDQSDTLESAVGSQIYDEGNSLN